MELQEVYDRLQAHGFVVVPLGQTEQPKPALLGFVRTIANPMFYRDEQPIVTEVRPRPTHDPKSYGGADEFQLHTDLAWKSDDQTPDLVFLYCVRPDSAGGGAALLADGWRCHDSLDEEDRRVLSSHPLTIRSHFDNVDVTRRSATVVTHHGSRRRIRFRRDLIEGDVPPAVQRFADKGEALATSFRLDAGHVIVIDNHRMLHGRRKIDGGLQSDRLLLRVHGRLRSA